MFYIRWQHILINISVKFVGLILTLCVFAYLIKRLQYNIIAKMGYQNLSPKLRWNVNNILLCVSKRIVNQNNIDFNRNYVFLTKRFQVETVVQYAWTSEARILYSPKLKRFKLRPKLRPSFCLLAFNLTFIFHSNVNFSVFHSKLLLDMDFF